MEGINKIKSVFRNKGLYISLALAFVLLMLFFPNEGKFKYEYQKGRPWMYETLTAPIDFPILKTSAELMRERDEAASKVVPYFIYKEDMLPSQLGELARLQRRYRIPRDIEANIVNSFTAIYNRGVISDDKSLAELNELKNNAGYIIVQKGRKAREELVSGFFTLPKAENYIKAGLRDNFPDIDADSLYTAIKLGDLVVPNLIYDRQTTDLFHKRAVDYISPTKGMFYTGQLIVAQGETVTAEIEQLLDSYRAEYELSLGYSGSLAQLLAGHAILILILLLLICLTLFFTDMDVFVQNNKLNFILLMMLLMFVSTILTRNVSSSYLFMVPFAVFALYMKSFFPSRVVFPVYMISLLPVLLVAENGVELYILNVFAGGVTLVAFSYLNGGWRLFLNALIIFVGLFMVYCAFRLMEINEISDMDNRIILYIFLNALFVVAAYPMVFLFEKIFSLVSVSTLRELSDTNKPLLQELARKAPGTFQHSLQVANLAERAAVAIGADARLVKVGAMYHDIGKLGNPQCFIENQAPGIHYHEGLSPQESAKEIIRHVEEGAALAKKYNLPQIVQDFITSHHGHSQTGYFYMQYCNQGGDPADVADFTYRGTLPTTKEQVVVMMADAVEAASRSLKDYSKESISDLVDKILSQRISDSQLAQADITIKEINIVKAVFKKHLQAIYHARIAYPDKKKDHRREVPVTNETE